MTLRPLEDIERDAAIGEFDHLAYCGKDYTHRDIKTDIAELVAEVKRLRGPISPLDEERPRDFCPYALCDINDDDASIGTCRHLEGHEGDHEDRNLGSKPKHSRWRWMVPLWRQVDYLERDRDRLTKRLQDALDGQMHNASTAVRNMERADALTRAAQLALLACRSGDFTARWDAIVMLAPLLGEKP